MVAQALSPGAFARRFRLRAAGFVRPFHGEIPKAVKHLYFSGRSASRSFAPKGESGLGAGAGGGIGAGLAGAGRGAAGGATGGSTGNSGSDSTTLAGGATGDGAERGAGGDRYMAFLRITRSSA